MDNTVVIISGVSPNNRAGESEVFPNVDSCEGSRDFNLWDNCRTNLKTGKTLILCKQIMKSLQKFIGY